MPLTKDEWITLEKKADQLRRLTVNTTYWAGSGHIGGGMSVMDLLTILYHKYLNIDSENPNWEDRDRFVLSKGHAGIAYAPVLCDLGWNDTEQLKSFNLSGSKLGMHLDCNKVVGVDVSSGSLGHGLSLGAGIALAARVQKKDYLTYVVTGDGELNEGSNWEAAMTIAKFNITNMITIVDANKCMIDGRVDDVMKVEPIDKKFEAFGFTVRRVDGQNLKELSLAIDEAIENNKNGGEKPFCIVMDTFKGAGIDFMEDDYHWHYGALNEEKYNDCMTSLDKYYENRMARVEREG